MQNESAISPEAGEFKALQFLFDEDGFLIEPDQWTRGLAQQLASAAEIGNLQDPHWKIIDYLRDKYLRLRAMPPMRHVCKEFGHERSYVKELFGGCSQLWRIAGLPNPGEEARSYMD